MGIEEQRELWAHLASLSGDTQRYIYQLIMNKSVSSTSLTHIEHTYLTKYAKMFEDVEAHEVDLSWDKIFLIGGGK